jgi:hypothetical protein
MSILSAVPAILATAFILLGLVALFGIGITGLLFLAPGVIFAAIATIAQDEDRAAMAVVLAAGAILAYMAVRKLEALFTPETSGIKLHQTAGALGNPGPFDYLPPSAALVLVGIGAVAVALDWRALRNAPLF